MIKTINCNNSKNINLNEILKILRKDGICILKNYYNEEELKNFIDELDIIFANRKNKIHISDTEECSKDERIFHAENYSKYILNNFANDRNFNLIARKYTKRGFNKKTLINRLEYEEGKVKNSGAGWHRDNHDCQFKTIMYLTDVTEKNGNFIWITNSSKRHIGKPKPRKNAYSDTRFGDETIKELVEDKKNICELINIVGEKGTIIIADTTYIHRGNIIQEGERRAITQYYF